MCVFCSAPDSIGEKAFVAVEMLDDGTDELRQGFIELLFCGRLIGDYRPSFFAKAVASVVLKELIDFFVSHREPSKNVLEPLKGEVVDEACDLDVSAAAAVQGLGVVEVDCTSVLYSHHAGTRVRFDGGPIRGC